ncbi:hypothetical protein T484DRAFT_1805934 [Baffinella frigidus]|nr:hypothetical protein T484DRAFT_1805934 [Cryptophyta sp. CCMP2293]
MRAGRLILGVFAITLLCGRYGNADDDVSLDHEDDVEEFDMEGLLDVLIKTRGRSAAPRAPAATAHPSYSAVPA